MKKALLIVLGLLVVAVAVYLILVGMGSSVSVDDLNGKSYKMTSYNGEALPSEAVYVLEFRDGSMYAKICNNMSGSVTLTDGVMSGLLASTEMYCMSPAGAMDVESAFGSMMSSGAKASLSGSNLTLSGGDTTMVFSQD